MNAKLVLAAGSIIILLVTGCGPEGAFSTGRKFGSGANQPGNLVNVGDTQAQVERVLGEPNIEFPKGDTMIRWYADYEVTTSNNVVVAVIPTSAET